MNAPTKLSERLAETRVNLRPELEFTRHVFRGEPAYLARDPITFTSHRLDLVEYAIVVRLQEEQTLAKIFSSLCAEGVLDDDDEEAFYELVLSLHRLGFLSLPISDGDRLYQRYRQKQRQARLKKITGILFLQIPIYNPDDLLRRTQRFGCALFSKSSLIIWLLLVGLAVHIVVGNWRDFSAQLSGFFALRNLALLWITLIGLKGIHEFGHAYACKRFGGHVPEMGVYLIALTPCAYVDASSSWSFTSKWKRLAVCFGGMYFELLAAALAAILWSVTEPGILNSVLHKAVILASIVTIGFNANPLMRFDGYFALSDAVEIPNLRARASATGIALLKRHVVGVDAHLDEARPTTLIVLTVFGLCAAIYRASVILGISAMIAVKAAAVGLLLGGAFIGMTLWRIVRGTLCYLWFDPESAPVRKRAVTLSVLGIGAALYFLCGLRMPARVRAEGAVRPEVEEVVRVQVPGFLERVFLEAGEVVREGELIARLDDQQARDALLEAESLLEQSRLLERAARATGDRGALADAEERVALHRREVSERSDRRAGLELRAPSTGRLIASIGSRSQGLFLAPGAEVATVGRGGWRVEVYLDGAEMATVRPQIGQRVAFRVSQGSGLSVSGSVEGIEPVGSRRVRARELTQEGGGDIQVNPYTEDAARTYFRIAIALDLLDEETLQHGMTGSVLFTGPGETLGEYLLRKVRVFAERIGAR